ncbi:MAG TPA: NUDIX domain-containing protein [Rhizomicrobium sp.]|jgi:predicted NUDIX family NTP pyrophosphohydrolase|nr:NUDIX domain-containing protein [Rhizomicrobium sp.]
MTIHSAGILLFRERPAGRQVFLIHPGGPFWANKDTGAWSIPKGMIDPDEDPLAAAQREFLEETGFILDGSFVPLGTFRQPSGKQLTAWAVEGDCDPASLVSNTFTMIWPPRSGRVCSFPEADRGAWFDREEAMVRILKGQKPMLEKFFVGYGEADKGSDAPPVRAARPSRRQR